MYRPPQPDNRMLRVFVLLLLGLKFAAPTCKKENETCKRDKDCCNNHDLPYLLRCDSIFNDSIKKCRKGPHPEKCKYENQPCKHHYDCCHKAKIPPEEGYGLGCGSGFKCSIVGKDDWLSTCSQENEPCKTVLDCCPNHGMTATPRCEGHGGKGSSGKCVYEHAPLPHQSKHRNLKVTDVVDHTCKKEDGACQSDKDCCDWDKSQKYPLWCSNKCYKKPNPSTCKQTDEPCKDDYDCCWDATDDIVSCEKGACKISAVLKRRSYPS